jgi:protein involved in gliding motility GldJ
MVAVEGGAFTMGQVQDDVMFDWNTTPKKIHVRLFLWMKQKLQILSIFYMYNI